MATNTSGGTTTSLNNTPQATDDSFNLVEDYNAIAWLDVMGNDLGGNAKILWSLDDTAADGSADLISTDVGKVEATSCDASAMGAKIWICDGKVGYDSASLSATFKAQLQALAVGEKAYDSFTYAIRLSNGTLSWATATVVYTGTNDGPDISVGTGDSASACLTETNSTLSTSGTLTVVDPDTSDTVGVSITGFSKSGNAGTLTDLQLQGMLALGQSSLAANTGDSHNLDWSFDSDPQTFDYLAAGESLTLTYTVTADDSHTGTDTQTITVTIKGSNDGPASVSGGTLNGGVEEESGTYTASGSFGFTDVDSSDTHSVSVTSSTTGFLGTLTPTVSNDSTGDGSGTVSWTFSVSDADLQFLGEGETRTQNYTVTVDDGHGGTTSQTVQIVLTGDEDPITITSAAQTKSISEDGTSVGGTIAFNDVDLSDTHTASAAANAANTTSLGTFSIDASVTEGANAANGSLGWSYAVNNSAAQYLAAGESVEEKYDVTFNDAHGSMVTETVTVTITGSNDGPDIRAIAGDSDGHDFDETDSGLSTSGTLTVTDPDTSDTIDTSVTIAVHGNQGSLSDADLLAMFGITGGTDANLAANTSDTNNLNWSFDSGSEAFDFLAEGEVLTVTYTLTSDDGNGGTDTQDVVITITGTNDAPELSASVTSHTYTDTANDDSFGSLTGTLSTVDPDRGDTATYSIDGGADDNSHAGYDTSVSSTYGKLYLNSETGAYEFVPNDTAIEALKTDDSVNFTLRVTDHEGATDTETLTINLDGINDAPELSATVTSATFTDTAGDDSFSAVTGDLSSTDRDSPETASYGVVGGVADNSLAGYDTSTASAYGKLYVDSTTGNYTFVPNDGAIEALKTDDSVSFTLKVTDGSGATDTETLTINLDGINDTASITGDVSGDVTEAGEDGAGITTATGDLDAQDRDDPDDSFQAVATATASDSGYGTYTVDSHGTWSYTLDNTNPDVQALNDGDPLQDTFTVYSIDGTAQQITVTIHGDNDLPFVSGDLLADVTEAGNSNSGGDPIATGTLTADDVDNPDNVFQAASGDSSNGYGTFSVDADGNWTYTLDNGNDDVQALNDGDTLTDYFTVLSDDGTPTQVQITIHGADDVIIVTPPATYTGLDAVNDHDGDLGTGSSTSPLITGTNNGETINGRLSGSGADTINALGGNDTVNAGDGGDTVYGGAGSDTIHGGAGNDTLYGQAGNDFLYGEGNSDSLFGGSGDDYLDGGDNTDMVLNGGSGNDTILGGANTDMLTGGFGADTLTGGDGSDTFVYVDVRDTNDTITDYNPGPDTISLTGIDANQIQAGNQAFAWGGTDPTAFGLWFTHDGTDTILYGDTDGDLSTAEFQLTLQNFSGFDAYADPGTPPPTTWLGL